MFFSAPTPLAGSHWYVVHSKPKKEALAASALKVHLSVNVYLPEVRRRAAGEVQHSPFFPGYLFIHADLGQVKLSSINATPCVLRLLQFGDRPQPLPSQFVERLREQLDDINSNGGVLPHNFREGDSVRLTSGPFKDLEALFVGPMTPSARVKVLLHFLGRTNEIRVDVEALERAHNHNQPLQHLRERGTRGRGRKINNVMHKDIRT